MVISLRVTWDNAGMSTIAEAPATSSSTGRVEIPSKRISASQLESLAARVTSNSSNDPMQIEQPFTGKPLGTVPKCDTDDVQAAISRAREAAEPWSQTSYAERKRILLRYHDLVLGAREELLDLLQIESGKARRGPVRGGGARPDPPRPYPQTPA